MGFLDDFGLNLDDVKEAGSFDVEDGFYSFVTSGGRIQDGTSNDENKISFVLDYNLFNDEDEAVGQKSDWFTVAERDESGEPQETAKAKQSLGYLKTRMLELGFKGASLNDIDLDDFEGITGTLVLKTKPGKNGGSFQNIYSVKIAAPVEAKAPAKAPAKAATGQKANPFKKPATASA